jgi:DNA-binding SARP family transcriptional activator/tetratricopeptide (TPR) repeat protein
MLRVQLLGEMSVEVDGTRLSPPESRRAWTLLAWLALQPGPHSRAEIAALFWPDVLDSSARASLRSAVWALRRALGPAGEAHLVANRDAIELEELWCDVVDFRRLVAEGSLEQAMELTARGELLAGFDDEWAIVARDEHRSGVADVLGKLAADTQDPNWARKRLVLDPLSEDAARSLMELLAAAGDRAGALAVYSKLRERFREELAITPSAQTRELAASIRAAGEECEVAASPGPPLVGRDAPLAKLLGVWREAAGGSGGVVCLSGEAGIGKTRLAGELLARAAATGARTASCAALDLGGSAPFALWAELLRELRRQLPAPPEDALWPADVARLAPQFGGRASMATATPELERARLFEAIVELLEWVSDERPLVLLLEDVHVADAASLELAAYAGRRLGRLPVLMILTRRDLPRPPEVDALEHTLRARGVLRLELSLGPLAAPELERLVSTVAQLDREDMERVVTVSEGNPLLAVESARAVAGGERSVPASLRSAVRVSFSSLSDDARALASFGAVAARELEPAEIEALELIGLPHAATEAIQSGLLVAREGRIGYRHALLRESVYHELPDPERAWLHERLATALDDLGAPGRAAEVARHLRLAHRDAQAVEQLQRAAHHAREVGALAEAASFLEEALEISPAEPRLLLDLAEVCAWRGLEEPADSAFRRAVYAIDPSNTELLARAWLVRGRYMRGALCFPAESIAAYRRTVEVLDAAALDAPAERAEALAGMAWAEATGGDPNKVEEFLVRLQQLIDGTQPTDILVHDAANARAHALIRQGRYTESYDLLIEAGEAAGRARRPDMAYSAWANAGCAAIAAGDFQRSLEFADRGIEILRQLGLISIEVHLLAGRSYILTRLGRLEEARECAAREHELAEQTGNAELIATADHDVAQVAMAAGEYGEAADLLESALAGGASVSRPRARLARAEALTRLGRLEEAEMELRETVLEPVGPADFPDTLVPRLSRVQGLIALARGDRALAERRLNEAADGWRRRLARGPGDGTGYVANLVDLGRPPVQGLVEPARELERVEAELRELQAVTT